MMGTVWNEKPLADAGPIDRSMEEMSRHTLVHT